MWQQGDFRSYSLWPERCPHTGKTQGTVCDGFGPCHPVPHSLDGCVDIAHANPSAFLQEQGLFIFLFLVVEEATCPLPDPHWLQSDPELFHCGPLKPFLPSLTVQATLAPSVWLLQWGGGVGCHHLWHQTGPAPSLALPHARCVILV